MAQTPLAGERNDKDAIQTPALDLRSVMAQKFGMADPYDQSEFFSLVSEALPDGSNLVFDEKTGYLEIFIAESDLEKKVGPAFYLRGWISTGWFNQDEDQIEFAFSEQPFDGAEVWELSGFISLVRDNDSGRLMNNELALVIDRPEELVGVIPVRRLVIAAFPEEDSSRADDDSGKRRCHPQLALKHEDKGVCICRPNPTGKGWCSANRCDRGGVCYKAPNGSCNYER